jgi:hypothetical protein
VQHPVRVHSVSGSTRKRFYPLGDIVDYYQDVLTAFRVREWSHEIDTPNIKDVDLEIRSEQGIASLALIFPCFWHLLQRQTNDLPSSYMVGQ